MFSHEELCRSQWVIENWAIHTGSQIPSHHEQYVVVFDHLEIVRVLFHAASDLCDHDLMSFPYPMMDLDLFVYVCYMPQDYPTSLKESKRCGIELMGQGMQPKESLKLALSDNTQ